MSYERRLLEAFGRNFGTIVLRGQVLYGDRVIALVVTQVMGSEVDVFALFCIGLNLRHHDCTNIVNMEASGCWDGNRRYIGHHPREEESLPASG